MRRGGENGCVGGKGTTSRGETAGQTGPMCVCSAVENNVHWEALMRFKNNGDYQHYSLGITRGDVRCCTALHRCNLPVQRQFHVFGPPSCRALPRYANANPTPGAWQHRITRGKTMPRKKSHYTAITIPSPHPCSLGTETSGSAFLARWRFAFSWHGHKSKSWEEIPINLGVFVAKPIRSLSQERK